jgi:hypothetical protein
MTEMTKTKPAEANVSNIHASNFEFVSNFEIRISDLSPPISLTAGGARRAVPQES